MALRNQGFGLAAGRAMLTLGAAVALASGWRRCLIAFATGAAGALAMGPFDVVPALFIPMTAAVWLIDGCAHPRQKPAAGGQVARALRAFAAGWWWGFGYFVSGLWWLGAAFLVEADQFAWALPLGVVGLPAVLAIFSALGFLLARLIWSEGSGRLFALAAALGLSEWLRGHLLTGFPWNCFGMALGGNILTAQLASLIGLYGLTVAAILIFSAPALLGDKSDRLVGRRVPVPVIAAALALGGICAFGTLRLATAARQEAAGIRLRILQPNVPQDEKFRPDNKVQILSRYLALSARAGGAGRPGLDGVSVLIWPESAFPFILQRAPWALAAIAAVLPRDTVLVTGAARDAREADDFGGTRYLNSIQVIDSSGRIRDTYDKVHLVPFGEYLPFQAIFDRFGLRQFVHVPGGFEAGAKRRLLTVPGLPPAAPLICYEAIFPGEVVPPDGVPERPGLLLNVTNDGWFGVTTGPYQHFAQARLRAIEEGLPLIRAANTGISAIVDPYGRVLASLPLGAEGVLDGPLPQAIAPPLFARFPFASAFLLWGGLLSLALIAKFRAGVNR